MKPIKPITSHKERTYTWNNKELDPSDLDIFGELFKKNRDEYVSKKEYDKVYNDAKQAEYKRSQIVDVLTSLVDGNEIIQRALIDIDPFYIVHIPTPYVSIQLEAIAKDPDSFHSIKNPSQEAIDTYRIVR